MTQKTKFKLFLFVLFVIAIGTVVLLLVKSQWAKLGIGAFLLWFSTIPKPASKEEQDAKTIRNTSPDKLRDELTNESASTITASPGEVEDIIETGLRDACKSAVEQRGSGKDDSSSDVDRKDNNTSSV